MFQLSSTYSLIHRPASSNAEALVSMTHTSLFHFPIIQVQHKRTRT